MTQTAAEIRREESLFALIERSQQELADGRTVDLQRVRLEHPELADEFVELWGTAQLAAEVGRTALEDDSRYEPVAASDGRDPHGREPLPRTFGEYELLEEIGRGGMGVVYRARQPSLDREVAVKMILRGQLASDAEVARFQSEAAAAAGVEHPGIVPIHEVGAVDGQPFFSMKLIAGTTLSRLLQDGPLSGRRAAELLLPVARGVAVAHRRGLLHRDLKPSNILVDPAERPHLTDFGLAKRTDTLPERPGELPQKTGLRGGVETQQGAIVGSPSYMAPEQAFARADQIGPASDVYGLGAVLYHMLTGRPPFQAASPLDTILMVREQDPLPPRLLNPKADPELEMVALKCLQKPADLRYATADALADDLEAYLNSEPVSARSGTIGQTIGRLFRETHHASVLENWGVLWMWHALVLLVICGATAEMQRRSIVSPWPYLLLWVIGLGSWATIFWMLRRRAGPVSFVERQIAHVWGASIVSSSLLFWIEHRLGLPVLTLAPVLALLAGGVFLVKAAMLSGLFYFSAAALFVTAAVMASHPTVGLLVFGGVCAASFFLPGLKYHQQSRR